MATNKIEPWYLIRDAKGKKSVSVTVVMLSFYATMIAYILSIFEQIGAVQIRAFDVAACAAFFTPCAGLYFGRRWVDAKNPPRQENEE